MSKFESLLFYFFWMSLSSFLIFLYTYYQKRKKQGWIFLLFAVLIMCCMMAWRVDVGTDYGNYSYMFNYCRSHGWDIWNYPKAVKVEYGFIILSKVLTVFFSNVGVWGILTFIFLMFYFLAIEKYNVNRKFSVVISYIYLLVFFYASSFNLFRQMIAFSICLYGMKFLFENNKKFFLIVLIAATIHYSSLVTLLFWFLWDHKNNKIISQKKQGYILTFALVAAMSYKAIFNIIIKIPIFSFMQRYSYALNVGGGGNRTFILNYS